jgi:hypothetical protein
MQCLHSAMSTWSPRGERPKPQKATDSLITDYWERVVHRWLSRASKQAPLMGTSRFGRIISSGAPSVSMSRTAATKLLNGVVTRKYGRRTLAHIRSFTSGIFTYATYAANDGLRQNNPWRNVKTKIKPPKPKESESRNAGVEKSSGPIRENPWPVRFCQRPSYFGWGTMRR